METEPLVKRDRRLMAMRVNAENLVALLTTGNEFEVIEGAPADAEVVAMERGGILDRTYNTMYVYLRSSSFEEVPEGQMVPELVVTVEDIR